MAMAGSAHFAWSSVYMNLWDTVYTWTTRAVMEYKAPWTEFSKREIPLAEPGVDWRQAQRIGEQLMSEQANKHGFAVEQVIALRLDRGNGTYQYIVRSSKEIQDRRGRTSVFLMLIRVNSNWHCWRAANTAAIP